MKTVEQIIKAHGGLQALRDKYISIKNEPYMRLVIEVVGGPREYKDRNGLDAAVWRVSVAHYGEQNGDAMRDPEMVFTVTVVPSSEWLWLPNYYRNDYMGVEYENEKAIAFGAQEMMRLWDKNIRHQGFLEAYLKSKPQPPESQPTTTTAPQ